jgi:hypothetical protein
MTFVSLNYYSIIFLLTIIFSKTYYEPHVKYFDSIFYIEPYRILVS